MHGRIAPLTRMGVSILCAASLILCAAPLFLCSAPAFAGETAYTLKGGETLFSVSKKSQVPVDVLKTYNGIGNPEKLKAGTIIRLPSVRTVAKGDTLYGIAKAFSVPLENLLALNGLSGSSPIKPGDRVFLPAGAAAALAQSQKTPSVSDRPPPSASAQTVPSSAARPAAGPGLAWPHPGRHEQFTGKFSGLVFHGSRGDRVLSATDGEVKSVMPYWGWGKTVIIKSPDGTFFLYAGNEEILVNVGDRVSPGMEIARLGVSPQGGGAKLYFCIQGTRGQYIDPEKYFSRSQA
jgi:lipoprotein YgeR